MLILLVHSSVVQVFLAPVAKSWAASAEVEDPCGYRGHLFGWELTTVIHEMMTQVVRRVGGRKWGVMPLRGAALEMRDMYANEIAAAVAAWATPDPFAVSSWSKCNEALRALDPGAVMLAKTVQ